MKFFSFFLILASSGAWANDFKVPEAACSAIDIRDINPELREHYSTPRNQGSIGWCYAFTAADMLSSEVNKPISAAHVSSIFNRSVAGNVFWKVGYDIGNLFVDNQFSSVYEGGYVNKAVKEVTKQGAVCSEARMPYDKNRPGELVRIISQLEALKKNIKKDKDFSAEAARAILENALPENLFGKIDTQKIYESLKKNNLNKVLDDLIRESCRDDLIEIARFKVKSLSRPGLGKPIGGQSQEDMVERYEKKLNTYLKAINSTLERGRPIGISYNVEEIIGSKGSHASVITARRWNQGKCEYKIRNSWGQSCGGYSKEIDCIKSEGAFWVSDERFFRITDSISFIPE